MMLEALTGGKEEEFARPVQTRSEHFLFFTSRPNRTDRKCEPETESVACSHHVGATSSRDTFCAHIEFGH